MKNNYLLLFMVTSIPSLAQKYSGITVDQKGKHVEYVNIGIIEKNIGTVSNSEGEFSMDLNDQYNNDSLRFSLIGYKNKTFCIKDFKNRYTKGISKIVLEEQIFNLQEVVIKPIKLVTKILGNTANSRGFQAGFKDNNLGYEMGIIINVKKRAFLEKLNLNIGICTYDSVFYRLNIYKVKDRMVFENILNTPVYISLSKEQLKGTATIDLTQYNIVTEGKFLITLEHVKDIGQGQLMFCVGLFNSNTYYRLTSQGEWKKAGPLGIGINVTAKVEQ